MKLLIILLFFALPVSFYSNSFTTIQGNSVDLSSYTGKKILLVNIATRGQHVGQIIQLQQLYQQHSGSLVVIGFPSNSFGNVPHSNAQLVQLFADSFNVSFPIATLSEVAGTQKHVIYDWLSDSTKNGRGSIKLTKDFQKILFSESGKVIGVYNNIVSPLDEKIQNAIGRKF